MIIYKAENLINGKVYIGKTIQGLKLRKYQHIRYSKNKTNYFVFHRALSKYGESNFKWSIIDTAENEKELNEKEIFWISEYKKTYNLYNMTNGGEGVSGYKHTDESKKKLSEKLKGKPAPNKGLPAYNKGIPMSEEQKKKMSEERKGKPSGAKGKKRSEESKLKQSIAMSGKIPWNKNKKKSQIAWNIGISPSEETKEKMKKAWVKRKERNM